MSRLFSRNSFVRALLVVIVCFLCVVYLWNPPSSSPPQWKPLPPRSVSTSLFPQLTLVDLHTPITGNFTCVKSKRLLNLTETTICLHDPRDMVSNEIREKKVWEESLLNVLLLYLHRNPRMIFLDLGANIGTYTMYAASMGKTVIAIECFKPNIDLIRRAVQIEHVEDRVTLIGNAIHAETGRLFQMRADPHNVGSQAVLPNQPMNESNANDTYVVRTIQFNEILPLLQWRNIADAAMKVDIQWAEMYLCQSGGRVFDSINIPVILMEWDIGARLEDRLRIIYKYFTDRGYLPTADLCRVLPASDAYTTWPSHFFWTKFNRTQYCA